MNTKNLMLLLCLGFFIGNTVSAQDFEYVGATKCKMCHNKAEKGQQYTKWKESSHAKAMETLGSDEAKKIAQSKAIADPSKAKECTKCHSTAASVDASLLSDYITIEEGVSCESCHGPGSAYKSKTIMQDQAKSIENGLVIPNEKVCVKCHNDKSPSFKGFNYKENMAKIAHPMPE